jgi:dipeptidyl aminopeptidase/acylaminoacyl peptidase
MSVADVLAVRRPYHLLLSGDGSQLLYMVENRIWVVNTDGVPQAREVGAGRGPQWRPDGRAILYFAAGTGQWVEVALDTRPPVAKPVLAAARPPLSFKYAPDGKTIALVRRDRGNRGNRHLWLFDPASGLLKRLTSGPFSVVQFQWSPDSRQIVFSATTPLGKEKELEGYVVELKSRRVSLLAPNGPRPVHNPRFTQEGTRVYYQTTDIPDPWQASKEFVAVHLASRQVTRYPHTAEYDVVSVYGHSQTEDALYFLAEYGVGYGLYKLHLKTATVIPVFRGPEVREEYTFSSDFSKMAFSWETANQPPEIYVAATQQDPRAVTALNSEFKTLDLGSWETVHWTGEDGTLLEGLLIKPVDYVKGRRYPLIVWLHGGPASAFSNRFGTGTWAYPAQVLAGKGALVWMPNPRGSTGYGRAFRRALVERWGEIDYQDVMDGIAYLNKTLNVVDASRIGVAGWSYGGYLGGVMLARSAPVKAYSLGAGLYDLATLHATIDIPDWLESYFKGTPKARPDLYQACSSLPNLPAALPPVLIQHGEKDRRVPVSQSRTLYEALSAKGCTVTYVEYKGEGHVPQSRTIKAASMAENVAWFSRHLGLKD